MPDLLVPSPGGLPPRPARWLSRSTPPPARLGLAGDQASAAGALRRLRSGESLVFTGGYHGARQLLDALGRRMEPRPAPGISLADAFHRERARRLDEQRTLNRLLVPIAPGWRVALPHAPDVAEALAEAFGPAPEGDGLLPLRELHGAVGAHEWRRRGVEVPALGARVHPHYGVFAPVRGEYVELVAAALAERALSGKLAFDVGTGTGVLAFLAARRGARVIATDSEPAAVACARDNAGRLGLSERVEVREGDLFPAAPAGGEGAPDGKADLVLCNPPWIPGAAGSPLDRAVYDPGSRFLSGFLYGLPERLAPGGEALLVLGDLAERLGLRSPDFLAARAAQAGLAVERLGSTRPIHPKSRDASDPLHLARAAELTVLWRLRPRQQR